MRHIEDKVPDIMHKIKVLKVLILGGTSIGIAALVYIILLHPNEAKTSTGYETTKVNTTQPESPPIVLESRIAFVSTRDGNDEIYTMRPDGSDIVRLTFNDALDMSPQWSPDGTRIAWLSEQAGQRDLYMMDRDGGNVVRLTNTGLWQLETNLKWSPDGRHIGYTAYNSIDEYREINQKFQVRVVGVMNTISDTQVAIGNLLDWSPDGQYILYTSPYFGVDKGPVLALAVNTGTTIQIARYAFAVDWGTRPDGQGIAYFGTTFSDQSVPSYYASYFSGIDEEKPIRLSEQFNWGINLLKWSPSGTSLAFLTPSQLFSPESHYYTASRVLYTVDASINARPVKQATIHGTIDDQMLHGVDWSPDDTQIVYASLADDGLYYLYLVPNTTHPDSFNPERKPIGQGVRPDWSPYLRMQPEPGLPAPAQTVTQQAGIREATAWATIFPSPTPLREAPLTVHNWTGVDICNLWIRPAGFELWGPNRLGTSTFIPANGSITIPRAPAGTVDILPHDCSQNVLALMFDFQLPVSDTDLPAEVSVRGSTTSVLINNQTQSRLSAIYTSRNPDGSWTNNVLFPFSDTGWDSIQSRLIFTEPGGIDLAVQFYSNGQIIEWSVHSISTNMTWIITDDMLKP